MINMNNLLNKIILATAVLGLVSATKDCFDDDEVFE